MGFFCGNQSIFELLFLREGLGLGRYYLNGGLGFVVGFLFRLLFIFFVFRVVLIRFRGRIIGNGINVVIEINVSKNLQDYLFRSRGESKYRNLKFLVNRLVSCGRVSLLLEIVYCYNFDIVMIYFIFFEVGYIRDQKYFQYKLFFFQYLIVFVLNLISYQV